MKPGTKTITLRVSSELYSKITDAASKEERSINNFITYIMKEHVQKNEKK